MTVLESQSPEKKEENPGERDQVGSRGARSVPYAVLGAAPRLPFTDQKAMLSKARYCNLLCGARTKVGVIPKPVFFSWQMKYMWVRKLGWRMRW